MTTFNKTNLDIELLPKIEEVTWKSLEPSHLKVTLVSNLLIYGILAIASIVAIYFGAEKYETKLASIAGGVWFFLLVLIVVSIVFGFKHKGFGLRDHDVLYKEGWIWRKETVVPFNRIQHVEIGEGPIARMFGLAHLNIYTAGGSQSDLKIPGLKKEEATNIKEYLAKKTRENVF